jgi:hypothetical protein
MKTTMLVSLLLTAALAFAQGPGPGFPGERPIERLENLRKVRMIEMLDLKEDQSVRFFARLNDHEKTRKDLRKQKNDVLDKIERLVRNHADGQEYEPLFSDVLTLDQKVGDENRSFFESLKDLLTTEQRGKLILFERKFEGELREAMREGRQRRAAEHEETR